MMYMRTLLVLACLLVLAGCGGSDDSKSTQKSGGAKQAHENSDPAPPKDDAKSEKPTNEQTIRYCEAVNSANGLAATSGDTHANAFTIYSEHAAELADQALGGTEGFWQASSDLAGALAKGEKPDPSLASNAFGSYGDANAFTKELCGGLAIKILPAAR